MADAAVTFLLDNVKQLLLSNIELITESENELKQLQNELELMKCFLEDSARKYHDKGKLFKQLERQVKDVVYEVEDTIDECMTQAAVQKSKSVVRRAVPGGSKRISLAKQVKHLREIKVKPVFDKAKIDFATLLVSDPGSASASRDRTQLAPILREDNVVGFEDEAETLIKYLNEESDELEVISIIGMPGLGKTTLAWKIYRDPSIRHEFPTMIWVYVSQEFNRKELFLSIIKKFTQQDMSSKSDQELAQIARSYLTIGKFLLFMDDVWTTEAWNDIQSILPKSNGFGKVLITSRDVLVGRHANPKRDPHMLRFLTAPESWQLFQLEVFGKLDVCPKDLEPLGKDIAKKCDGLPLAIVVIGGILLEKYSVAVGADSGTKKEWEKVSASVGSYLSYDRERRTEKIISLSYRKLPYDLIDCFLYLGMFPEDFEIPAWRLTRLWIAEGFILPKPARSLEEIAENNLKELINRNLVMVEKLKPDGGVKTCRVHDVIHEFCKNEAVFQVQNLFQEMRMSKGVFEPPISNIQNFRRICVHSSVQNFFSRKPNAAHVRSFLCFSKEAVNLQPENVATMDKAFNLLRVLDAVPLKLTIFPVKLTKLIHLRYIALCCDSLTVLPEAITKLWNVQTIMVDTLSRTLQIKGDLLNMMQLRHFNTNAAIILSKKSRGGDGDENLQTLSRLSPESCTEEVFDRAPNLKILGIRGRLATLLDSRCLSKLSHLEKLKLVNDVFPDVASENPLQRLPQPDQFPPNLRNLTLSATFLDWKHMAILGALNTLEVLKLKEHAFVGTSWEVKEVGVGCAFQSLEFLHIERTDLTSWTISSPGSFPRLKHLVLKKCEKLEQVPLGLSKSLQKLELGRVTASAVDSAQKIKQEKETSQGAKAANMGRFKLVIAPEDQ